VTFDKSLKNGEHVKSGVNKKWGGTWDRRIIRNGTVPLNRRPNNADAWVMGVYWTSGVDFGADAMQMSI
jgi:hypothetical protein